MNTHLTQSVIDLRLIRRNLQILIGVVLVGCVMASGAAGGQPRDLADLLMAADQKQFAVIFPKVKEHSEKCASILISEISQKRPPDASDEAKDRLATRQANAAVALLKLNQPAHVWPLLKHNTAPRVRSYLVHRLGPFGTDPKTIIRRLDEEPDITIRRALVLSLGEFDEQQLPPETRNAFLPKLQEMYRTGTDPGLHAACEWLLREWEHEDWLKELNETWAMDKEKRGKLLESIQQLDPKDRPPQQWYVNSQGQTLVVMPGLIEFVMGSPKTETGRSEDESQHNERIEQSFAIASKEVTVQQFLRFQKDRFNIIANFSTAEIPMNATWFDAAAYCNWLNEQEGIPREQWCYEPDKDGKYESGMQMTTNHLRRTGYRLPTEAEWEYSCRAGTITGYSFGGSDDLLRKYGVIWKAPQNMPVGSRKPNDFGLFDMHGNNWEWCQELYRPGTRVMEDRVIPDQEIKFTIHDEDRRVLRGGSFNSLSLFARSAHRNQKLPKTREFDVGFRVAKTIKQHEKRTE